MMDNQQISRFAKWISRWNVLACTSEQLYDAMESQSAYGLPVVYQPFNPQNRFHWGDAGRVMDFLYTTDARGKRVLDFGPGDGWPSLMLAPFVGEVTGVDASEKRVAVCRENARRMGITNASFVRYEAGGALPFADGSFDSAVAASSVEQCPNPKEMLGELFRVLKPGGKLRMYYEGLARYSGGEETDFWLPPQKGRSSYIVIYLRDIPGEAATQYLLEVELPRETVQQRLAAASGAGLEPLMRGLRTLEDRIGAVYSYRLRHPSGGTWAIWLRNAGFGEVLATHDGGRLAASLFEATPPQQREIPLEQVYERILEHLPWVCRLEAPLEQDPMLLAAKPDE